ncbi:hypothetical protein [Sulfuriflexus mobilis]|uniref:hypothetical protein n=1 Tax=Sulfuriflexus mobilis TaxID=1811807 RepID=UPI000F831257|nr:hypothetical protein [Sulfuriflexus mobilis]
MINQQRVSPRRRLAYAGIIASSFFLSACDPISLTALGIGASTGVNYGLNSVAYKTFTAPISTVNKAAVTALKTMGIKIKSIEKTSEGQVIIAQSSDREIELTLEAVSKKTTRLRSIARQGTFLMDRATATEIIFQTEKALVGDRKVYVGA